MYRIFNQTIGKTPIPTGRKLLAMVIAGLMTTSAIAQSDSDFDAAAVDTSAEFNKFDTNQNNLVEWSDIQEAMEPRFEAVNLDARATFDQYDRDGDNALNEQEFESFILSVRETEYGQDSFETDSASAEQSAASAGFIEPDDERTNSPSDTSYGATDAGGGSSATVAAGQSTVNSAAGGEFTTARTSAERNETTQGTDEPGSSPGNPAVHSAAGGEFRAGTGADSGQEMSSADHPTSRTPHITEGGETSLDERPASYDTRSGSDTQAEPIGQAEYTSLIPEALINASLDSLTGKHVRNANGDKVGKADDIVVNRTDGKVGFVVSSGGVLGIGERKLLAPVEELTLLAGDLIWDTSQSKKDLRDAHTYHSDDYVVITEQYTTLGEIQPASASPR